MQHWLSSGSEISSAHTLFSQDFEHHKLTIIFIHHQKKDPLFPLKKTTTYHLLVYFCNNDSGCKAVWFWVSLNNHFLFGKINQKSSQSWEKRSKSISVSYFMFCLWLRTYSNWEWAFYSLGLCQVKQWIWLYFSFFWICILLLNSHVICINFLNHKLLAICLPNFVSTWINLPVS